MRSTFSNRINYTAGLFLLSAITCTSYAQSPVTPPSAYGTGVHKSFVRTWDAVAPLQDPNVLNTALFKEVKEATQYFDGLGRPLQTVVKKGSLVTNTSDPTSGANAVDIISASVYDEFGREQYKYLPFAANTTGGYTTNDGLFKFNPFQQQADFATGQYPNEAFYYGKTNFEASPLNRVNNMYAPGDSWVGSESNSDASTRRNVAAQYLLNEANDSVRVWTVSGGSFSSSATYAATQLYETVTIDERKNKIVEYKDKEGHVILKKVQISGSPSEHHTGWLCTYYVYDDFDLLRGVIQPKGVEELQANGWTITSDILNELCFRYEYDGKNRMIVKKVPGAGEVRMVYDKWDRLVLSQDATLRVSSKWLFTKYDLLNRPIMTGFYTNTIDTTQSNMQTYLDVQGLARYENYQTASFPLYSLTLSFPSVSYSDVLTITYYDDYSWAGWYGSYASKDNTWDDQFETASNGTWPYPQSLAQSSQTKGMVTGVWDKTNGGLLTATYYDDKGRVVQTKSYNHTGGIDIITVQYTFTGQVVQTVLRHQKSGTNSQTHLVQTRTGYDEAGRPIEIKKKLNSTIAATELSEGWHITTKLEFDALGQLKKKILAPAWGSGGLDELVNSYNIRGWLTAINKDYVAGTQDRWFGMELGFDKDGYGTYAAKQFNGNITGTIWRAKGDGERRKYDFGYDATNRLLKADFTQKNGSSWDISAGIDYSMKMGDGSDATSAYDANGNIMKMWQRGWKLGGSVTIDSLIYKSNDHSNKLKYVRDGNNAPNTTLGDFKEPATNNSDNLSSNTADYAYDGNGNMISDANKAISSISYNHLSLPTSVSVTAKGTIEYVYDNGGNKLKKIVTEGSSVKTTLYVAGFVYENDTLQLFQQEEGRIRLTTNASNLYNGYAFDYFEKDHLGNVRVVLTEQRDTARYPHASMETGSASDEDKYYLNLSATRENKPSGYPTDTYNDPNPNDKVAKLRGDGNKIGPAMALKVMAGDKFNIRVSSYYKLNSASPQTPNSPVTDLIAALISGFGGVPGGKATATELSGTGVIPPGALSFYGSHNSADSTSKPKAFLNWVLFDEQFNYVSSSSGFEQVGSNEEFKIHLQNNLPVDKSGYLYIYVSNETPNISVFFDNLQVTHLRGPLVEETHYYPWGLTMAGVSSKAFNAGSAENKYKYNGYELNKDFDLNLYETFYRSHDPQLGRFWQIDPRPNESVSLYASMNNNPLRYSDPLGDTIIFTQAFLATKYGQKIMELYKTSETFKSMLSAYDIGGEGSFFGGEAGEYANNTNVVFDVINDTDGKGNSKSGGGKTTMQVQNNNGDWVDVNSSNSGDLSKDSKTRINILLNPDSKQSNTLQKAANITTHELTVHGAGFMNMSDILHSMSPKDFVTYRNAGNNFHFADKSRNNILTNGYYNPWVQHGIVGMGLNGYYNSIRAELNAALSKQGESGIPNDAKAYKGEVDRVRASFQNINQITQLGIYGPQQ